MSTEVCRMRADSVTGGPGGGSRARAGGLRLRLGVAPHDERVLAVVGVVAAADAARAEAHALVEPDRVRVRDAHLERVAAAALARCELEEAVEQRGRDPAPAVLRVDGEVHDVPRV